jgi:hypothetical protein
MRTTTDQELPVRTLKRLTLTIGIIVASLVAWQASAAATAIEYGLIY